MQNFMEITNTSEQNDKKYRELFKIKIVSELFLHPVHMTICALYF